MQQPQPQARSQDSFGHSSSDTLLPFDSLHDTHGSASGLSSSGIVHHGPVPAAGESRIESMHRRFPPMPKIGLTDRDYSHMAREAERSRNIHGKEAAKVGMYITSALDTQLPWEQKLRYFEHALKRHCVPPHLPDEDTWLFYRELATLVKTHCGHEALRLASREDDFYAARLGMGQSREKIEDEAEAFFTKLIGNSITCPDYLLEEDWHTLLMIRDQWI
ncbi:MAG: hypothetical protein QM770_03200 [Tepidisphaeraceae bacterium]